MLVLIVKILSAIVYILSGLLKLQDTVDSCNLAVNANNRMDEQFEANVEALADDEIFFGQICAYDINVWCIYFDPYEEYEARPI